MRHVLLLDNFDSFTYNLVHYIEGLDVKVDVIRSTENIDDTASYDGVIISPGPGIPKDIVEMTKVLNRYSGRIPILGVCLGMQGIAEFLGGEIYNQNEVKHGVEELITLHDSTLFKGLAAEIKVGLYHSWAVTAGKGDFNVISVSKKNVVMALENESKMLYGVQFHPESIMTLNGKQILQNFLLLN